MQWSEIFTRYMGFWVPRGKVPNVLLTDNLAPDREAWAENRIKWKSELYKANDNHGEQEHYKHLKPLYMALNKINKGAADGKPL